MYWIKFRNLDLILILIILIISDIYRYLVYVNGEGNGSPLPYSCLENPHGQRSQEIYSPQGHTESDTTKATYHTYMQPTRDLLHTQTNSEEMEKIFHINPNEKKAGVADVYQTGQTLKQRCYQETKTGIT